MLEQAKHSPLWPAFKKWCADNHIGDPETESEEDWLEWWNCFLSGALAQLRVQAEDKQAGFMPAP